MLSDPIADMLTRIRNGYLAHKGQVLIPYSKIKEKIANVLVKEEYLKKVKSQKSKIKNKEYKTLICQLKYKNKEPAIKKIIRISKPGLRVYTGRKKLPKVLGGMGLAIISTPEGIMSDSEARKKGIGGEVICKVW